VDEMIGRYQDAIGTSRDSAENNKLAHETITRLKAIKQSREDMLKWFKLFEVAFAFCNHALDSSTASLWDFNIKLTLVFCKFDLSILQSKELESCLMALQMLMIHQPIVVFDFNRDILWA
jgi:hypothetical protein